MDRRRLPNAAQFTSRASEFRVIPWNWTIRSKRELRLKMFHRRIFNARLHPGGYSCSANPFPMVSCKKVNCFFRLEYLLRANGGASRVCSRFKPNLNVVAVCTLVTKKRPFFCVTTSTVITICVSWIKFLLWKMKRICKLIRYWVFKKKKKKN